MRKIIFLLLIYLTISKFSFSQFKFGFNYGLGLNKEIDYINDTKKNSLYNKNSLSFIIGVNTQFELFKFLKISSEINGFLKTNKSYNPILKKNIILKPFFIENPYYLDFVLFKFCCYKIGFSNNFFINVNNVYTDYFSKGNFYTYSFLTGISFCNLKKIEFQLLYNKELKEHLTFIDVKSNFRTFVFKMVYYF